MLPIMKIMDPHGTENSQSEAPTIRPIEESNIPAVINLYKLNYGDNFADPRFYDEKWIKRQIYSESMIWLILEEKSQLLASGAIILSHGDYNDQIGEIGRLVVHPKHTGRGLMRHLIDALLDATGSSVEFAFVEPRTTHTTVQGMMERVGYATIGFLPQTFKFGDRRESMMLYANLYGNRRDLRSNKMPQVIPEVKTLAQHALSGSRFAHFSRHF